MPDPELLRRVEMLERTVESLQSLPTEVRELRGRVERVESQILTLRTEMRDELSAIRRDMVTKADFAPAATKEELRAFATKDDLRAFATKDDLRAFATKDDLRAFATKEDLRACATKEDLRACATKEDLKAFPTREEMHDAIGGAVRELSGAIVEIRDDLAGSMRDQIADARRHTTLLFEDLIARLKITGEGTSR